MRLAEFGKVQSFGLNKLRAGFVGAQPLRGEPEGCPLGTPFLKGGWGRSSATAMRSEGGDVSVPPVFSNPR
jgi:hypothetical protein